MKNKIIYFALILIIVIFTFSVLLLNKTSNNNVISTSGKVLSNKKIEWGIKRNNNHNQPDLGSTNKRIIDEFNGIAMGNKDLKKVYLTFDMGYEAGYFTSSIILAPSSTACMFRGMRSWWRSGSVFFRAFSTPWLLTTGATWSSPPRTIMLKTLPFFISAALSMASMR